MTYIEELLEKYPVRKTAAQKAAFRDWMQEKCAQMNYPFCADAKGYSRNVTIGTPEMARVVFTAHYDTPPRLPFPNVCTPKNKGLFLLVQAAMCLGLIGGGALLGLAVGLLTHSFEAGMIAGDAGLLLMCGLMMFGPANPSCVNDNSSGVAAVLEIMSRLPEEARNKAAFVLFDNEEKGLLGSMAFAGKHPAVKKHRMVINLDCVGDGESILLIANKATRNLPIYPRLTECLERQQGRELILCDMENSAYPSDQANFRLGIGVCACRKTKKGTLYFGRIHTPKDTVCDQANLDFLAGGMAEFMTAL